MHGKKAGSLFRYNGSLFVTTDRVWLFFHHCNLTLPQSRLQWDIAGLLCSETTQQCTITAMKSPWPANFGALQRVFDYRSPNNDGYLTAIVAIAADFQLKVSWQLFKNTKQWSIANWQWSGTT
ncbi:hypothetical protein [Longitalea luteola]|uniref:hypothetical protein n=1 Tax=Longitalea luteola TaxID=2812563 RepID=UPI001A95747B|nr:hypothetical protein [Longitalea luteola]